MLHHLILFCEYAQNAPVARGRTRRPLTQTELIKSRTHARGMSERSVARGREDSRTQGLRAGARQNTHKPQGRARARGAHSQTGKQWRVRAPVAHLI